MKDAASRMKTPPLDEDTPPPIPDVPPPDATPSGAQRLDALIGAAPPKNNGVSSKKVSFASAQPEEDLENYDKDPNVNFVLAFWLGTNNFV